MATKRVGYTATSTQFGVAEYSTDKGYAKPLNAIKAAIGNGPSGQIMITLFEEGQPLFTCHGTDKEPALQNAKAMLADLRRRWQ